MPRLSWPDGMRHDIAYRSEIHPVPSDDAERESAGHERYIQRILIKSRERRLRAKRFRCIPLVGPAGVLTRPAYDVCPQVKEPPPLIRETDKPAIYVRGCDPVIELKIRE